MNSLIDTPAVKIAYSLLSTNLNRDDVHLSSASFALKRGDNELAIKCLLDFIYACDQVGWRSCAHEALAAALVLCGDLEQLRAKLGEHYERKVRTVAEQAKRFKAPAR